MNKRILFILLLVASGLFVNPSILRITPCVNAATIGTWNSYLSYKDITAIEQGDNIIYVLASNHLYSYNKNDQSIITYSKINGLNDTEIDFIKWCNAAKKLLIIYSNQNIDILDTDDNVANISDYYNKSMTADKTINHIYINGQYAYLSTSFGILKINMKDNEISDTYNLSFNVNYTYIEGNKIFAASEKNGLYSALLSSNLLDPNNWSRTGNYTKKTETIDPDLLSLAQTLNPSGPAYNNPGYLKFHNGKLYCTGGHLSSGKNAYIQVFDGNDWTLFSDDFKSTLDHRYIGMYALDIDPNDENHVVACGQTGIYEFNNMQLTRHFSNDNSPLQTAMTVGNNNKNYVMVYAIAFDAQSHIWCFNSISATTSLLKYADGQWTDLHSEDLMYDSSRSMEQVQNMMFDENGRLWFTNNHWRRPSLTCYNPATNQSTVFDNMTNQDGSILAVNAMPAMARDKSGNMWIGTDQGVFTMPEENIGNASSPFTQIKVPRNDGTNYADYLLNNISTNAIAVDGAGRKWIGTESNGVYLISEDNYTQIYHFTSQNSKLLSNNVNHIAINQKTGEVFFATDKGICSFMSDATDTNEEMNKDQVYAYPNPVHPDYTGLITISGLTYNAQITITTSNGRLVNQGRSNGGIYTWDGCDENGRKVASGIYMVHTATAEGKKGTVCKIAIVN